MGRSDSLSRKTSFEMQFQSLLLLQLELPLTLSRSSEIPFLGEMMFLSGHTPQSMDISPFACYLSQVGLDMTRPPPADAVPNAGTCYSCRKRSSSQQLKCHCYMKNNVQNWWLDTSQCIGDTICWRFSHLLNSLLQHHGFSLPLLQLEPPAATPAG